MTPLSGDSDRAHRAAGRPPPPGPSVWSSLGPAPRGEGLGSLAEALDRILCKGVSVDGAVTIGVAGVELVLLDLRLLLAAIDTVRPEGSFFSAGPLSPALPVPPVRPGGAAGPIGRPALPLPPARADPDKRRGAFLPAAPTAAAPPDEPFARKGPQHGLVRLVLTLVNLLHEVLERQALRRMDNDTLTPGQIEDVGAALHAQTLEIARLREQFGLSEADLTLRLSATG